MIYHGIFVHVAYTTGKLSSKHKCAKLNQLDAYQLNNTDVERETLLVLPTTGCVGALSLGSVGSGFNQRSVSA